MTYCLAHAPPVRPRAFPRPVLRSSSSRCMASSPASYTAALFDLDGTLLDIEPLSTLAINQQCVPCWCRCAALTDVVHSIEPLGGHVDARLKRLILGQRAAQWTRTVIEECGLQGKTTPEALEEARQCIRSASAPSDALTGLGVKPGGAIPHRFAVARS